MASETSNAIRERLPRGTEQQLFEDIEKESGLHNNKTGVHRLDKGKKQGLDKLLDEKDRPELYGERGSALRLKVRKRVSRVKGWTRDKYLEFLENLGVEPHGSRFDQPQSVPVPVAACTPVEETDAATVVAEPIPAAAETCSPPKVIRERRAPFVSPLRSEVGSTTSSNSNMSEFCIILSSLVFSLLTSCIFFRRFSSLGKEPRSITLSIQETGNQGEGIVVTPFWKDDISGMLYDGVELSMEVDIRDVRRGLYKLEFLEPNRPGDSFLLTIPKFPSGFFDPSDKAAYDAKETNSAIKEGHDIKRNQCCDKKTRQPLDHVIHIGLIFDDDDNLQLSDLPYNPGNDSKVVNFTILPYLVGTGIQIQDQQKQTTTEIKSLKVRLSWRFVNITTARPAAVAQTTTTVDDDIARAFASMGI